LRGRRLQVCEVVLGILTESMRLSPAVLGEYLVPTIGNRLHFAIADECKASI